MHSMCINNVYQKHLPGNFHDLNKILKGALFLLIFLLSGKRTENFRTTKGLQGYVSEISAWKGTGSYFQIQEAHKECLGFWNELLSCTYRC